MLLDMMQEEALPIFLNTTVLEITGDGVVTIDTHFNKRTFKCDTVALAVGMTPENTLYQSLIGERSEVYAIGDCFKPRKLQQAIFEGYTVAMTV